MIRRLMATIQSVKAAPPHPLSPILAGALIVLGTSMLTRFTSYQRAVLTEQAMELNGLMQHIRAVRIELGPDTTPATMYPAREDVDPLARAAAGDDPHIDSEELY